ncbi:MAG: diguanylate cyclase, partial [Raoultibacter sp.]
MLISTDSSPTTEALLLDALDHNITAGIKLCECTETCHLLYVNDGLVELSGYPREELIGNSYALLVRPEEKDDLIREIKAQSKTQGYFRVTYQLKRKNGTFVWILDSGIIRGTQGRKTVIQSVMMDISNHKKVQNALEASQQQYEAALKFSDVTMFEYDIKTKKILTQSKDFDTYGMPGVIENGVEAVIAAGVVAKRSENDLRDLYRAIDEGAPTAATVVYANDLTGVERTLELQMIAVCDDNNTPAYAVGVRKDITEAVLLHKEKEYNSQLTAERRFICEANVTQDKILYYNTDWAQELGLSAPTVFSDVLRHLCETQIDRNDAALFITKPSLPSLQTSLDHNERLITFEYRRRQKEGKCPARWFEATLNIIRDEVTEDISVRIYITDIDKRKQDELRAKTERKRHELMLSKSTFTYEVNLTQDLVAPGQENLEKELNLLPKASYSTKAIPAALMKTYPEDQAAMAAFLAYDNLRQAYDRGTTGLEHDYRYRTPAGAYPWRRISLQLFTDEQTHDLMCFASIEDINEKKEADLALLYQAQHDLMTGFYNKQVTRGKIDAVLSSPDTKSHRHIFFIVDLDYFKLINDRFGHAFGDAVLSQSASKIADLFRAEDILGRIGGDEFVIFMKSVRTEKLAFLKAQEICDTLTETYQQNGAERELTASVGIAISGRHGTTYDELYRHSDTALYNAKKTGRHRYSLYSDDMQLTSSAVHEIDFRQIYEGDTFNDNISEYVFRILYESSNKQQAINSVLDLVGKHYGVSRIYIFENSKDGTYLC